MALWRSGIKEKGQAPPPGFGVYYAIVLTSRWYVRNDEQVLVFHGADSQKWRIRLMGAGNNLKATCDTHVEALRIGSTL